MKSLGWPPYVINKRGRLFYRPRIPKDKRHLVKVNNSGFISPAVPLGTAHDPRPVILSRYKAAFENLQHQLDPAGTKYTLGWLYSKYKASEEWMNLSKTSRVSYEGRLNRLMSFPVETFDGTQATVSDLPAKLLTRPKVKSLHKKMLNEMTSRGLKGVNEINGRIRQLSALYSWTLDTYEDLGFEVNPCHGFRKPSAPPPERYVTDQEYWAQVEYACIKSAPWLPVFYELAYLLASRSVEVRNLTTDSIKDIGVRVDRRKGSKTNIITWSDRLNSALESAQSVRDHYISARPELSDCPYVLINSSGRIRKEALGSAQQRLKRAMDKDCLSHIYWAPHDLKRKGISDAASRDIAGHRSEAMKQRYDTAVPTHSPAR